MIKKIQLTEKLINPDGTEYQEEAQSFTTGEALSRALKTAVNDPATGKAYTLKECLKYNAWAEAIDQGDLSVDEADQIDLIKFIDTIGFSVSIKVQIGRAVMSGDT